jgi:hypothetical protein
MRRSRGLAALALLCSAGAVTTCVYPTERDSSVHVSLTALTILIRSTATTVTATAWRMIGPADSQPIPNVVFDWSSSDSTVATVSKAGRIVGIKSGIAIIRAAALNFGQGQLAAADTVRVSAPLEIDSVRPRIVRYGELLSVYGVGVDSIFAAQLSGTPLFLNVFGDTAFADGTARRRYWVPPPAHTDSLFFFGISGGQGVLGFVHGDTTRVVERDLYEPDDTVPQPIDLDAPPPFAIVPTLRVFNPALAFELLKRDAKAGADWYHFTQGQTRDLTFILTAPQIAGTFSTFLTDSLGWNGTTYVVGKDSWTFGPGSHVCHGRDFPFKVSEAVGDSTIVAFKSMPVGSLDAIAVYTVAGRYGLAVWSEYRSELPADAHEDDNSCNAADLRGTATLPFRDTLAIENPHDIDWIRFSVPSLGAYEFRLDTLPGAPRDSLRDLDLYVVRVPVPSDASLQVVLTDTTAGPSVDRIVTLTAGSYYAVVLDFAGRTTRYQLCVEAALLPPGGSCAGAPFPAPPAAGTATAPTRRPRGRVPVSAVLLPSRR